MLDKEGYRPNVGIVLANQRNEVFWGKRVNQHAWQFPQGGIQHGETPLQAMYRELGEEIGLHHAHVRILGRTRDWLRYEVPQQWMRGNDRMRNETRGVPASRRSTACGSGWLSKSHEPAGPVQVQRRGSEIDAHRRTRTCPARPPSRSKM